MAAALDPHRGLDHYGHQVWRTDSGLPQNNRPLRAAGRATATCGLGTDGGLVRFDGIDFVTFNVENTPQFASDTVYDLMQDDAAPYGSAPGWACSATAEEPFRAYTSARGLPPTRCGSAIRTAPPGLGDYLRWARYFRRQALHRSGRSPGRQPAQPPGPGGGNTQGTLWLGGSGGVFALSGTRACAARGATAAARQGSERRPARPAGEYMDRRQRRAFPLWRWRADRDSLAQKPTALHPDAAGGMWVGTAAGVLHAGSDGALEALRTNGVDVKRVDRLFHDRQGVLWISTERGVFRLVGDQLQSFAPGSELADSRVLAVLEDREGDVWLGTDSGGLHLLRDQKFTTYTATDGLSGNLVRCVFQSANGDLWIGTDGAGLNRRSGSGFLHYTTANGLSSNVILSLADAPGGGLWIGTPDGLNLLQPGGRARPAIHRRRRPARRLHSLPVPRPRRQPVDWHPARALSFGGR